MKFQNNVLSKKVAAAIIDAELLLDPVNSPMLKEFKEKNDFKYNSGTGEEVYTRIAECNVVAPIFTYRPKWPWSKALGYSDKKGIFLNVYKIESMSHADLVGLLIHEWLHNGPNFNHGTGRFSNYKTKEAMLYSVNYFASENVARWL